MSKTIGRNEPCPCGSGKKFKKCKDCNYHTTVVQFRRQDVLLKNLYIETLDLPNFEAFFELLPDWRIAALKRRLGLVGYKRLKYETLSAGAL